MLVTRIGLFAMLLLCWSAATQADSQAVVFGSFVNKDFAESRRFELERMMGVRVEVVSARIRGITHYRTLVYRDSKKSSRELVLDAKRYGIEGAWVLNVASVPGSTQSEIVAMPAES